MSVTPFSVEVRAVLAGRIQPFRAEHEPSAIAKRPVSGKVAVGFLGLACDEQADKIDHGGRDKALHHYAFDHYAHWREVLGEQPLLDEPGGFGENISTLGLTESDVFLGDRFRLGSALVEVSHGRQPCWKLGHRFTVPSLAAQVVKTRRSGWYYRVIEEGEVEAGDRLELVERGLPEWPVERLFSVLIGGGHKHEPALLPDLARLEVLAGDWRERAVKLMGEGK